MEPVDKHQTSGGIWIVVLAAGHATRMGTPKMLLQVNGEGMLKGIVRTALSVVNKVAVVLKREGKEEEALLNTLPVTLLKPAPGKTLMSDSLKTAIEFCVETKAEAVIILLGDQPGLDPVVISQLKNAYEATKKPIIQAKYWDGPGHPILFDQHLFAELLDITGDQGARAVLKRHSANRVFVPIDHNQPKDIDTLEDYFTYIKSNGR